MYPSASRAKIQMMKRRSSVFLAIIAILFSINIFYLVQCALVIKPDEMSALASQYTTTITSFYPRGTIYDRNDIRLTNRSSSATAFLDMPTISKNSVAKLVVGDVLAKADDTTESGAYGANGLQMAYDKLLNGGAQVKVTASVDAARNIISESGYQVIGDHPNEGCTLKTTIDYHLQKNIEEQVRIFAEEGGHKGVGVVLSEVKSGDVLAMVSYGDEMNKAVLSYQPGSLMKIIVTAVALEFSVVDLDERFECTGVIIANNAPHYCANRVAHGDINFQEAFSKSCNSFFYEVAKRLEYVDEAGNTRNYLADTAKQWGFNEYGSPTKQFELEYSGHYSFVSSVVYNDEDVFNNATGQGKTQASPFLLNSIIAAIANSGKPITPKIVTAVTDPAGNKIPLESEQILELGLSAQTIDNMQFLLKLACTEGTGSSNTLGQYGGMAGKTGTAQNFTGRDHSWFAGYFPADNPKYAMTVLIEEGGSSQNALELHNTLADTIYRIYPQGN
ncbi:MAG: penicillin-binding transpeptidase domain-containing protein [Eubacteriaceae bacterium]|nr:penicillin-binding transpeptidase domain-containing protein [Eubacteriaceae bacterium]